jgi:hypothetical protein
MTSATVQDIYERYRIMPSLQLHQLRVAAVGKLICDSFLEEVDEYAVMRACLFHDMGNIIKSDLVTFPDFVEPEGFAYWHRVREEFVAAYGHDEHQATLAICREIGLDESAYTIIERIGFSNMEATRDSGSTEMLVSEYCDLRVGPHGIISMQSRIDEGAARYRGKHPDMPEDEMSYQRLISAAYAIETKIFARTTTTPEDITEQAAEPLFPELRRLEI